MALAGIKIINMTNNDFSPVLQKFVDGLIEEKKLGSLDPEILAEVKNDLLKKAEDKVKVTIFDNISEENYPEFNKLMEAGDDIKLQTFIKEQIPNLEELTAASLLDFRNTYLG